MSEKNVYKCKVCGRAFFRDETKTVIPDDNDANRLSGLEDQGPINGLIFCEECRKLPHYERRQLYLLNCILNKERTEYNKDIRKISKTLEDISNIPGNFTSMLTSGRSFKFKLGRYRGYYNRKALGIFRWLFKKSRN